jgi:hypothetical protein
MANIAGIDCGLTLKERTSGICRTGANGFVVGHTYIDKLSRNQLLLPASQFDCLGIDAPILPKNVIDYSPRPVESVFMRGAFQIRCKPGASHVRGTGQALRRSGCDAAMQFTAETFAQDAFPYPRVQANQSIVEAFPNAFLGVLLDQQVIDKAAPSRGQKTNIFFSLCNTHGAFQQLEQHLGWQDAAFWEAFQVTSNHEDLAALVCAATAICAHLGKYVAVGDVSGGYFFLPAWCLWKPWAKAALRSARKKSGLRNIVKVWIDGSSYGPNDQLP